MKVVAIAQFPPVEGVPTADGPINFAIAKFAREMGADLLWVYAQSPKHQLNWEEELDVSGIRTIKAQRSFRTQLRSARMAVAVAWRVLHFRRIMLVLKEGGVIAAGAKEAVQQLKPDIIFLSSPYSALLNPRIKGTPTVYNSMDSLTFSVDNGLYGRGGGIWARFRRWLIHRFDRFACFGHALIIFVTQRDAETAPYAGRVAVIENGADLSRFRTALSHEKNLEPTLVFQGSVRYPPNRRGLELIISEIAPLVWREIPTAVFRFVGAENDSLSNTDNRLQFVGYVDDLGSELRRAWVSLAPIEDGSGIKNKVLDAASSGLPVIGFAEAFNGISDFSGGIIATDPSEFAHSIIDLLRDKEKAHQVGLAARRFAESHSWKLQVSKYVQAFKSVIHLPEQGASRR